MEERDRGGGGRGGTEEVGVWRRKGCGEMGERKKCLEWCNVREGAMLGMVQC